VTKPFDPLHPAPCCYFKHGAYWFVKRGKWYRIGATLEEAMAEYARRVQAPKIGKLSALIDETLVLHFRTAGLSANTCVLYLQSAKILKRRFAQFDTPDQIKSKHVAQVKVEGAAHPNMTNRTIGLLRTLFGYWVEQQRADSNPCVGVRRHREAKRKRLLKPGEWRAIHDRGDPLLRATMKLQLLTGQRIGDVLRIGRGDLLEDGIAFAQQKTGSRLVVEWSDDLRDAVAAALALHGSVPGLWLLPGPPSYDAVYDRFRAAAAAAGVADARLNDQRAQALTAANGEGKDATALAGHSSTAMTQRYLRDRAIPRVAGPNLRQALDVGQKSRG
jgi:integrase